MAVLEREPGQPRALLRVGQIRSWTNDPRGAIPFLEKRLETRDEEEPVVRFYLGEAYWSVKRDGDAAREHRAALEALTAIESPDRFQRTITAKILTRLGRVGEARPVYAALLEEDPDNVGLLLDYADALASVNLVAEARPLVDRARAIDASGARGMRLDGQLRIREGRHADAAALLRESLERHGPDAGVEADLGRALELHGDWRAAADAYGRSLELQKDNLDLERTVHDLRDQLADLLLARIEFARAGDDRMLRAEAVASHLFEGDLWRGAASVAFESLRGPAAAAGGSDVETFLADLSVSALRRFGDADCAGGGVTLYPGAEGDLPMGLWAGASLARLEPFREAHVRVHLHELWRDPAAAAGLGGRKSGIGLGGQAELGARFWAAADFGYDLLSLSEPEADDGRIELQAVAGYRLVEGRFAHANRLDTRAAPFSGLLGPQIEFDPVEGHRTAVSVWLSYFGIRMLGDAELTALLPIGERFDYLTANARADFHLAPGLGGKVEGYAGTELNEGNFLWGLETGLTWRSRERMEMRLSIVVGQALGRSDADAIAAAASLGLEWRW
jgi:tetratricopeptide (TPR) repeat protein